VTILVTAADGGSAADAGGNVWSFGSLGCGTGETPLLRGGALPVSVTRSSPFLMLFSRIEDVFPPYSPIITGVSGGQ